MGDRLRALAWLIVALVLFSCLAFNGAQEDRSLSESGSVSTSISQSESIGIEDKNPCSFRGSFLLHGQKKRLDPCTLCTCENGTTTCEIESCPADAGCLPSEIVNIEAECCPQCPYKMFVENTNNLFDDPFDFAEGDSKKIRFGLDIEVDRKLSSRLVRGNNLWKLGAWVSSNEDGSGQKYSLQEQIFNEKDAAQEYFKQNYPPWEWNKLKYTMNFLGGTCEDYNYFCVEFGQADEPEPTYDLAFTFQAVDNERERLIDCVPLGECRGLEAEELDWELEATNAVYGESTPISLNVEVGFTPESPDKKGEGMWRVGIFGSGSPTGAGARFGEKSQTLDEEGMATRKKGRNLRINDIAADFEIGTIGCTDDNRYVCVEFAQGDDPDPPFTLLIDTPSNTLVTCKEQECSARAIFTTLAPDLTGDFPVFENKLNTIRLNLDAITDKDLSTSVPGESLWELGSFFNARANGKGPRIKEVTQILDRGQQDQDLIQDENLEFDGLDFQTDLSGVVCADIPYICFELKKHPAPTTNYIFGTNPEQDPFVECQDFSDYCKGVVYNGIVWDRRIPSHTPGSPVGLSIDATIEVDPNSRSLSGSGLYEMAVYVASDPEGEDKQTPEFNQVLTPSQMSTRLPAGGPLVINGIRTPPFVTEKLGCAEFRYLCVEFRKGARARPDYTAEFTQAAVELGSADEGVVFKDDKLIQCREEKCPGIAGSSEFDTGDLQGRKETGSGRAERIPSSSNVMLMISSICIHAFHLISIPRS